MASTGEHAKTSRPVWPPLRSYLAFSLNLTRRRSSSASSAAGFSHQSVWTALHFLTPANRWAFNCCSRSPTSAPIPTFMSRLQSETAIYSHPGRACRSTKPITGGSHWIHCPLLFVIRCPSVHVRKPQAKNVAVSRSSSLQLAQSARCRISATNTSGIFLALRKARSARFIRGALPAIETTPIH